MLLAFPSGFDKSRKCPARDVARAKKLLADAGLAGGYSLEMTIVNDPQQRRVGEIVQQEWFRSAEVRSGFWIVAGMVMPNHLHGVVVIEPEEIAVPGPGAVGNWAHSGAPQQHGALQQHDAPQQNDGGGQDGRRLHRPPAATRTSPWRRIVVDP